MSEKNDAFIDEAYDVPSSGGKITKFAAGDTRLRILCKPVLAWVDWAEAEGDNTNVKTPYDKDKKPTAKSRHSWFMLVWNYTAKQLELWDLSQKSMQEALLALARDPDWGSPLNYDLKVNRVGTDKNTTKYVVTPYPAKKVSPKITAVVEKEGPDLSRLFTTGNVFDSADVSSDAGAGGAAQGFDSSADEVDDGLPA